MSLPRAGKYEMLKQVLVWTGIIAVLTFAGYSLMDYNDDTARRLYSLESILWILGVAFAVALAGVIHYHWLFLRYWVAGKRIKYVLFCAGLFCAYFAFYYVEIYILYYPKHLTLPKVFSRAWEVSIQGLMLFYLPFIILYAAIQGTRRNYQRNRELGYEQRKTAILLLKNKLEPHFLFNTLNSIYAIAQKENADKTITVIDALSEQVREKIISGNKSSKIEDSAVTKPNKYTPLKQFLYIWLGISGFLALTSIVGYIGSGKWDMEPMLFWVYQPTLIATVALAIVSHFYWLYKPLFMEMRYTRYFLLLPVFIALMILIDASVNGLFDKLHFFGPEEEGVGRLLQVAVWRVLIVDAICAWVYAAASHYKAFRKQTEETEQATRENELRLLQSKVDTTTLFNSLNTLHETVNAESAPETTTAVNELISLFHYSADKADKETVPVQEEIQFIEQYLHLQKMRVQQGERMVIHSSLAWDNEPANIAPMLLLPYIENAFKYGISYEHPSEINIEISIAKQILECRITNTDHSLLKKHISPGIGLADTTKRLQLQYEGKYLLEQKSENGIYSVYLRTDLHP